MAKNKTKLVRWEVEITDNKDISPERAAFIALRILIKHKKRLAFSVTWRNQQGGALAEIDLSECAVCDNCGNVFKVDEENNFTAIIDLYKRIEPGGMVPVCECPKCGALAYPADKMIERAE